jgi:Kelch motif
VVPPQPAPSVAAVVTNPTAEPTPSPTVAPSPAPTETPAVVPPRAPSWTAAGSMTWPGQVATRLLDGRVLAIGGWTGGPGGCNCAAQLYDPATGSWTATGNMLGEGEAWAATLLASGKVLVAGGDAGRAQLYDPATGSWTATGSMGVNRQGFTASLLPDGEVLAAGGYSVRSDDSHLQLTSAELYDPATGFWTATGDMLEAGMGSATLLRNGKVLVMGGADGPSLGSAELYDPATRTWSATGSMRVKRQGFATALLPDGKVLVAGGTAGASSRRPLGSAELYDPATGTWTATGSMALARTSFTATLLLDGKVLVAGGWDYQGNNLWGPPRSAELYDPATGTWTATATASVVTPRAGGSATLLLDGRVLVAGGDGGDGPDGGSLASADLYDPATAR